MLQLVVSLATGGQEGQMEEAKYLDVQAAATRFGVSVMSIYRLIWAGRVRVLQAGRRRAVEVAGVREYYSDAPEIRHILDAHIPNHVSS